MNLPNKLTMASHHDLLFVIFMLTGWGGEASKWISLAIFNGKSDGSAGRSHRKEA